MAETKGMTAEEVVGYLLEGEGLDFLRESLSWVGQQLMEAEVSELVGAARGERAPEERLTRRNGYRQRPWATRAGELELAIPKLRRGSYFGLVICLSWLPLEFITKIADEHTSRGRRAKAILFPSGDQAGNMSSDRLEVRRCSRRPAGLTVKICQKFGALTAKAIVLPSGDQLGFM